jgi:hypothetical protein
MKKLVFVLLAAVLLFSAAMPAQAAVAHMFVADLSGANEVPPRMTDASGTATFNVRIQDGTMTLGYSLVVASIENVVAAHIHCAPAGVNGPVGVTLYMAPGPGGGMIRGEIASGIISAPDAGNSCGWMTVEDVVTAFRMGGAYVNVHTNDGVPPTNTGPGDFPGGEIRGQIENAG